MKKDISNIQDIKLLVDVFYGKVREDGKLKDIFNNKIQDRWPEHLEKMYRFWQTVLLEEHTYYLLVKYILTNGLNCFLQP